jgi:hypothetical protein
LPQRDSHDHALLLLSKARTDKLVLDKLVDDSEIADDAIGFHTQQAVEKLLKAVLANRNVEYPRVHDIDRLVDLLEAHDGSLPPQARQLDDSRPGPRNCATTSYSTWSASTAKGLNGS